MQDIVNKAAKAEIESYKTRNVTKKGPVATSTVDSVYEQLAQAFEWEKEVEQVRKAAEEKYKEKKKGLIREAVVKRRKSKAITESA